MEAGDFNKFGKKVQILKMLHQKLSDCNGNRAKYIEWVAYEMLYDMFSNDESGTAIRIQILFSTLVNC